MDGRVSYKYISWFMTSEAVAYAQGGSHANGVTASTSTASSSSDMAAVSPSSKKKKKKRAAKLRPQTVEEVFSTLSTLKANGINPPPEKIV
ncbi:hypothetical protein DYB31_014734, partial [Aphanomyces astaci]